MRSIETPLAPQTFCDGLATFYCRKNIAGNGNRPVYQTIKRLSVPYADKKVGDVRYYAAIQADSAIDKVIRVPCVNGLQTKGDICVISGSDLQFLVQKIAQNAQTVPASWDVTLEIKTVPYELETEAESDDD